MNLSCQLNNDNVQNRQGDGIPPSCAGATPNVLPEVHPLRKEENSHTGVSTRNALPQEGSKLLMRSNDTPHWYVLRCTYGREKKAYEHLCLNGIKAYYPTITTKKEIAGKVKLIEESRLPNIFFAKGTLDELKEFVYDNVHEETKHLRFYYNQHHYDKKEPLIVPDRQMHSLMLIWDSNANDLIVLPKTIEKFSVGQYVLVKEGMFKGVEGIVARFSGQQRVGIVINGLLTAITAYIPTSFLKTL